MKSRRLLRSSLNWLSNAAAHKNLSVQPKCHASSYMTEQSSVTPDTFRDLKSVKDLREVLGRHVQACRDQLLDEHGRPRSTADADQEPTGDQLEPRWMKESVDRFVLPLSTDHDLRLKYRNLQKFVRFGRLMEDLDTFVVWLSYRHNQGGGNIGSQPQHAPMAIVTACVDQILLHDRHIFHDKDIVLEGHVSWTGNTSIEATVQMLQQHRDNDQWRQLLEAKFVMVATHPLTKEGVRVHPLQTSSIEEQRTVEQGNRSKSRRQAAAQRSLLKQAPTECERLLLHELFLKTIDTKSHSFRTRILPEGHVWLEESKLKTVVICFPEQRNLYNKIFGGFLMRQAFELAFANAHIFSKSVPFVIAVDDIMFRKSVDIGALLFLSSEVVYTESNLMQVRVHAEVKDPKSGRQETTNTFHFTFGVRDAHVSVPSIMPRTYADGMLFLSGKRHFDEVADYARKI